MRQMPERLLGNIMSEQAKKEIFAYIKEFNEDVSKCACIDSYFLLCERLVNNLSSLQKLYDDINVIVCVQSVLNELFAPIQYIS